MSCITLNPFRHQDRCLILKPNTPPQSAADLVALCHDLGVHTTPERYPGGWIVIWILLSESKCAEIRSRACLLACVRDEPADFPADRFENPPETSTHEISPPQLTLF